MSTLRVDNILDRAGTKSPALQGLAKAWVNFNGTGTVAIRDSFNVSSITDNAVGDFTVNLTTAMPSADYVVAGLPRRVSGNLSAMLFLHDATAMGVSSFRVMHTNQTPQALDADTICLAVFGD